MKAHIAYLKYVVRHKWFVLLAGLGLGVPIHRLVAHDWDKFLPNEWFPYVRTFYKADGSKQYAESQEFSAAWNRHQKRNRHHWQYWLLTWDRGETVPLEMEIDDAMEMLADWIGAGRAITGTPDPRGWYQTNKNKIILHHDTRDLVEAIIQVKFGAWK